MPFGAHAKSVRHILSFVLLSILILPFSLYELFKVARVKLKQLHTLVREQHANGPLRGNTQLTSIECLATDLRGSFLRV